MAVVEGAALGAAFEALFRSVVSAARGIVHFRSRLDSLKSSLVSIKLAAGDIDSFNNRSPDERNAFAARIVRGEEVVQKCNKVKWWNVAKRFYYAKKLGELEASLVRFFQVDVAALHFRESERISVRMRSLEDKIDEISVVLKRSEIGIRSGNTNPFKKGENEIDTEGLA